MTVVDAQVRTFELNGRTVSVRADHDHLLAALRDELGITSTKDGCSPSGQCGCCTVLLDGKAVVACQIGLDRADGKDVTTLEGLPADERARFARAFAATGALVTVRPTFRRRTRTKAVARGDDLHAADTSV